MRQEGDYYPEDAAEFVQQGSVAEEVDMTKRLRNFEFALSQEAMEEMEQVITRGIEQWVDPRGALNELLIKQDLPPIGSRLLALFHDVKAQTEPAQVRARLERLGQEEINKRWKIFKMAVALVKAQAQSAPLAQVTMWMLGPNTGERLSTRRKFALAHGKDEKPDWGVLKEELEIEQAAQWLCELADMPEQQEDVFSIEVDPELDPLLLDLHFGESGPQILYDILPKELRTFVGKINIGAKPLRRRDEYGAVLKGYPPLYGQYNTQTRELFLAIDETLRPAHVTEVFIHEFAHALGSEDSARGRAMRKAFVQAAAREENSFSNYVQDNYALLGMEQGLEEDFAVSMQFLFQMHEVLEDFAPVRLETLVNIFKTHFPKIDLLNLIERFDALAYEAGMRERQSAVLAKDLLARSEESHLEVLGWFSALEWRPLSFVLATGPANQEDAAFDRTDGSRVREQYDAQGCVYERVQTFLGGEQMRLFYDAEHDGQGRLTGYKREIGGETNAHFQLHYEGEDTLPSWIDVHASGKRIAKIDYAFEGDMVTERTYSSEMDGDYTEIQHKIHNGLLFRSTALVGGEPVFERVSFFDDEERELSVKIVTTEGIVLSSQSYEYDN